MNPNLNPPFNSYMLNLQAQINSLQTLQRSNNHQQIVPLIPYLMHQETMTRKLTEFPSESQQQTLQNIQGLSIKKPHTSAEIVNMFSQGPNNLFGKLPASSGPPLLPNIQQALHSQYFPHLSFQNPVQLQFPNFNVPSHKDVINLPYSTLQSNLMNSLQQAYEPQDRHPQSQPIIIQTPQSAPSSAFSTVNSKQVELPKKGVVLEKARKTARKSVSDTPTDHQDRVAGLSVQKNTRNSTKAESKEEQLPPGPLMSWLLVKNSKQLEIDVWVFEQKVEKSRVGDDFQAVVKACEKKTDKRRKPKELWSPDYLYDDENVEEILKLFSKSLNQVITDESKALKLLVKANMDQKRVSNNLKKNREVYKEFFEIKPRKDIDNEDEDN